MKPKQPSIDPLYKKTGRCSCGDPECKGYPQPRIDPKAFELFFNKLWHLGFVSASNDDRKELRNALKVYLKESAK
jgi:hypothetical protein